MSEEALSSEHFLQQWCALLLEDGFNTHQQILSKLKELDLPSLKDLPLERVNLIINKEIALRSIPEQPTVGDTPMKMKALSQTQLAFLEEAVEQYKNLNQATKTHLLNYFRKFVAWNKPNEVLTPSKAAKKSLISFNGNPTGYVAFLCSLFLESKAQVKPYLFNATYKALFGKNLGQQYIVLTAKHQNLEFSDCYLFPTLPNKRSKLRDLAKDVEGESHTVVSHSRKNPSAKSVETSEDTDLLKRRLEEVVKMVSNLITQSERQNEKIVLLTQRVEQLQKAQVLENTRISNSSSTNDVEHFFSTLPSGVSITINKG